MEPICGAEFKILKDIRDFLFFSPEGTCIPLPTENIRIALMLYGKVVSDYSLSFSLFNLLLSAS